MGVSRTSTIGGPVGADLLPRQQRASSGAWTIEEDRTLLAARAAGENWSNIQRNFPGKTGNACRKRHERLRESRASDSDLERMCKEYVGMRESMWKALAKRCDQNWKVVEQKCMSYGLEYMQNAAQQHSLEVSQSIYKDSDLALGDDYGQPVASSMTHHGYTSSVSTSPGLTSHINQSHGTSPYILHGRNAYLEHY
ncbi:hypothetical protein GQ53DRAFT_712090 [Thozetella sp. PMI_491]|nr:hypothetical protein GQ53DRAFT_712090 [Thozetella sp. PMI_491]